MPREDVVVARSGGRRIRPRASNDSRSDNKHKKTAAKNGKTTSSNAWNSVVRSNRTTARNDSSVGNSNASSNSRLVRNGNNVGNSSASNSETSNSGTIRSNARANVKIAGSSNDSNKSSSRVSAKSVGNNSDNSSSRIAIGSRAANVSSKNSSRNSNVASSGNAIVIAIATGMAVVTTTTFRVNAIGGSNSSSAPNAITRIGSDGRTTWFSVSDCSSSSDV